MSDTPTKKIKAKGPIRFEAIIPVTVIFALTYVYFHFFFDAHLRKGIEWGASYAHGAEVNVGGVTTSFIRGQFSLRKLEVTDKSEPMRNLLSIGEVRFGFMWDALLRAKFVVDEAAIENIQAYSPRRSRGWVRPPKPPSGEPSAIQQIEEEALRQVQDEYAGNMLGDLAQLLGGTDKSELLKGVQDELQAEAKIKELEKALKEKEQEWKKRLEELPNKEQLDELAQRAKAIDLKARDPRVIAENLKNLREIGREADSKVREIRASGESLKGDVRHFNSEIGSIDDLIKQDIRDIQNRVGIPDLDAAGLSKGIFGAVFAANVAELIKYVELSRQYMPPKMASGEKPQRIVPPPRGEGVNYSFPVAKGYPGFWLKKATISSEPNDSEYSGRVRGELTHLSTAPTILPDPMRLRVEGDFPKVEIHGFNLDLLIDHRTENPKQILDILVGRYPVRDKEFSRSRELTFGLEKARGQSHVQAQVGGSQFSLEVKNQFTELEYLLETSSRDAKKALETILAGIPMVDLNARASGSLRSFRTSINSNLGRELSRGLQNYVKAELDALRAEIEDQVLGRVKEERAQLNEQYEKVRSQVDRALNRKNQEVESAQNEVKSSVKGQESSQREDVKEEVKDRARDTLRRLGF